MAELTAPRLEASGGRPWWKEMTSYHWLVFAIASMSWLFDCMDQRFFIISRDPALRSLLPAESVGDAPFYGRVATAMIMLGWAVGGFFFGLLGDRLGRVKTMMITILIYAGFTGLSALSVHWWDFIIYRFLMGLGVGGLFAAAVSLVAEVTPPAARPHALGLLQALSAVGNIIGSAVSMVIQPQSRGWLGVENWRWLFLVGVLPALLVVLIQRKLREPESWQRARTRAAEDLQRQLGAWGDLFSPGLRRNTLVGLALAISGVIGLWGVGFFSPELVRDALSLKKGFDKPTQDWYVGLGMVLQDLGAFFGIYCFTMIAARLGRKPAFGIFFLLAFLATVFTFRSLHEQSDIFWMLPILGFANLSVFGGYSIYFPELYPTRLRSSGVGFCYNVGRVVTAVAIIGSAYLMDALRASKVEAPFRVGSVIIAGIYFLGILVLLWAPETRGRALQED
jgi:MFS family permease